MADSERVLSASPEWATRYQEYLVAAAARAKHTRDLYREVVDRVAAGELAPEALDDRLPSFLQAHGAAYANRLAETTMRFLTGLVEAGTTYSRDLVDRILPGTGAGGWVESPSDPVPPSFESENWADWLQRLTDYAAQQNEAVTEQVRAVMERVAAGELVPAAVKEASAGFRDERLPDSVAEIVGLYFNLLSSLDETGADFGHRYLDFVLAAAEHRDEFTLDVNGPLGTTVAVRLAVANTQRSALSVRCVLTDVRRPDGVGPAFAPQATLTPERFDLSPGEERALTLSVFLAEGSFDPGAVYAGTLHVLAPGETVLALPVRIQGEAPLPTPPLQP